MKEQSLWRDTEMRSDEEPKRGSACANCPELSLVETGRGLAIKQGNAVLWGDFARLLPRIKPSNLGRELIVRAAKPKASPEASLVVDVTAGLGEDSFLLAAAGFRVLMFEHNQAIASLLDDAISRARRDERLAPVVSRMELRVGDGVEGLFQLDEAPDTVFLDPMFPDESKGGAAKKKLQVLQALESPCIDEDGLLHAALTAATRKVIVKRPAKGPYLAGAKPSYMLKGKAIRFDCYASRGC